MIQDKKVVLIVGGRGLIGSRLTNTIPKDKYIVRYLSSNAAYAKQNNTTFHWDVDKKIIDNNAFQGVDVIVNLAGYSIANGRWTAKRKKKILESRVQGTRLLSNSVKSAKIKLETYIGASAIGYYGSGEKGESFDENSSKGTGFLAHVCCWWKWWNVI